MALTATEQPERRAVERLLAEVPRFSESESLLLLDDEDREVPGLVFSAFASFLLFEQRRIPAGESSIAIDAGLALLEEFASSDDDTLHNLLVTEVFENWDEGTESTSLRGQLGEHASALHRRWIDD